MTKRMVILCGGTGGIKPETIKKISIIITIGEFYEIAAGGHIIFT